MISSELLGFRSLSIVSKILEYRTMDDVRKPRNSECYTPSSKPFRVYMISCNSNMSLRARIGWQLVTLYYATK
jgi:hypothetical protein